ncbi:class I SAM-dependent methyltransferase [Ktedonosporobacter rubrisoli]|uniref:class I SAM-dependent methyltransferase n=1 Tax=Ktedonosporobacter rubrisoli TaxID=2509675 RepID=UPI0024146341|nr:class I SAM-dependent methyltransferase [Ktedonosporobacter rubrisoli]
MHPVSGPRQTGHRRCVERARTVQAIDLANEMLKVAAEIAREEGVTNLTTRVMNAERLELDDSVFDAVICRYGLMLIPHLSQALSEIYRVLKPAGHLAAIVWSTPESNPIFGIPFVILKKYVDMSVLPWAGESGPFSLAAPGKFEGVLRAAGFRDVGAQTIPLLNCFASVDEVYASYKGVVATVLQQMNETDRVQLEADIKQALRQFEVSDGVELPGQALLGYGTK